MVNQALLQASVAQRGRGARGVRGGLGGRHRHGSPGLRPYRDRVFDPAKELHRRPHTPRRRQAPRHLRRDRAFGSQVAMAMALFTALTLLLLGGYQAASGAVAVAGMFG